VAAHCSGEGVGRVGFELSGAFQTVCVNFKRPEPSQSIYSSILFIHAHKSLLTALDMLPLGFVRVHGGLSVRQCQYPFPRTLASRFRGQSRVTISGGASPPTAVALSCSSIIFVIQHKSTKQTDCSLFLFFFFFFEVRLALYENLQEPNEKAEYRTSYKSQTCNQHWLAKQCQGIQALALTLVLPRFLTQTRVTLLGD
jgi:hypothetical protein